MTSRRLPPLAVLDWGIGGFGLVAQLRKQMRELAYTYVSDSGFTPYGKVAPLDLSNRLSAIATYLHRRGVTQLIIACNAASTVAPRTAWPAGLLVQDILSAALAQALAEPVPHLGIVGGIRTIRSQALAGPLRRAGRKISQRIAQPLSAHIERGKLSGPELSADLDRILKPLQDVDALLLACTHYPAITALFTQNLPMAKIIDPVHALIERIDLTPATHGQPSILTTGDTQTMARAAHLAFGIALQARDIERVDHVGLAMTRQ